ncbi:MAG: hypothetical protein U0703_17780 [Anaerolineae bacterium]
MQSETGNVPPRVDASAHLHGARSRDDQLAVQSNRLEYFYSDVMTASERDTFFANPCALTFPCAGAIRYVMFGPLERALAPDGDPAWAAGLTKIYDLGAYAIYATGR